MLKGLLTLCTLTTPFPLHSPVCCSCMKASVLLALGPLPPGYPPMPVPFLAGTTQPCSGSGGGPRMGEPPSCACVQLCRAACCAFAPVHAPCPSPPGEGLEGHLPAPRAFLLALCARGGCLWGDVAAADRELGVWTALGGSLLRPWLKLPCLSIAYVTRCFWPQVEPLGLRD